MVEFCCAECHLCRVLYAEWHKLALYTECHYAEGRGAECRYAEVCGAECRYGVSFC